MQSIFVWHLMCGMSWASYWTLTGASRPGIVSLVCVIGPDATWTVAVRPSAAAAASAAVAAPGGGVYTTWSPALADKLPPPASVHVTVSCAVVCSITAELLVVPVLLSVFVGFVGLLVFV